MTYPNGAMLLQSYDVQDQLRIRREQLPPGSDSAFVNADTLTYDARSKVVHAVGHTEEDFEGYAALGTLWAAERTNVHTGAFTNTETFTADAMGTVVSHEAQRKDIGQQSLEVDTNVYVPKTGRLIGTESGTSQTLVFYTAGGDRMSVKRVNGAVPEESFGGLDDARYYYRADGLLAAVDHRTCTFLLFPSTQCASDSVSLGGSFEDYRYDALGRRVLVRTRTETVCTGPNCHRALMWVAWDGDQIAAEVRGAGSTTLSDDSLEMGLPPRDPAQQPFYGTVSYLNGPTMDQPLEIQGIIPYRTWRGVIDGGSCGDCPHIDFPALTYEAYLDAIPTRRIVPHSWHGTLFADGLDDSGLMYRRNRYYDPATGQFTQEDPIGLAGGLNAYGYANGDPVDYSDPFGLCVGPLAVVCAWIAEASFGELVAAAGVATVTTIATQQMLMHPAAGPLPSFGADATFVRKEAEASPSGGAGESEDGKRTPAEVAGAVNDAGGIVTPHTTRTGEGATIKWPDGSVTDVRVENHPIPGSKGQPVKHGNVETWDAQGNKVENKHILPPN